MTFKQRQRRRHQKTEMEFAAKFVNDQLRKRFPDKKLQFMSFVMDEGDKGYLGYIASTHRMDAVRVVMEWFTNVVEGLTREEMIEIMQEYIKETPDDG